MVRLQGALSVTPKAKLHASYWKRCIHQRPVFIAATLTVVSQTDEEGEDIIKEKQISKDAQGFINAQA